MLEHPAVRRANSGRVLHPVDRYVSGNRALVAADDAGGQLHRRLSMKIAPPAESAEHE
jgi:hypothetical protein